MATRSKNGSSKKKKKKEPLSEEGEDDASPPVAAAAAAPTELLGTTEEDNNNNDKVPAKSTTAAASNSSTSSTSRDKSNKMRACRTSQQQQQQQRNNRKELFESLHQEMEVAEYGRVQAGHFRRVLPRDQSKARTQKRKLLESQDAQELSMEMTSQEDDYEADNGENSSKKRLRGPMAAAENHVIQGSLVFGGAAPTAAAATANQSRRDFAGGASKNSKMDNSSTKSNGKARAKEGSEVEEEYEQMIDNEDEDVMMNEIDDEEEDLEDEDDEDDDDDDDGDHETNRAKSVQGNAATAADAARQKSTDASQNKTKKKKRMYRLKNFKSHRMAQRHGEAVGAYVQGRPKVAIAKLKELAHDAPLAPQVYSSLGMVYQDMLKTLQKKESERGSSSQKTSYYSVAAVAAGAASEDKNELEQQQQSSLDEEAAPPQNSMTHHAGNAVDQRFKEQLDVGKKAYGSYHIAAILCKQDYTLWVRAADLALDIADIHERISQLAGVADSVQDLHYQERTRWLSEAKNDYQTADRLKPPGIEVPAKLASIMIKLGHLSDALTLLTDLKNRPYPAIESSSSSSSSRAAGGGRRPSEFESSYKAWLLYSDLMLRIGFECNEWNRGCEANDNYMFRRWLRKWADSFDWEERRMQALVKALEVAAGTASCRALLEWMEQRAMNTATSSGDTSGGGQATDSLVDAASTRRNSESKDETESADPTDADVAKDKNGDTNRSGRSKSKKNLNQSTAQDAGSGGGEGAKETVEDDLLGNEALGDDGQQDETFLVERIRQELEDFDKTTRDLGIEAGSLVAKERDKERSQLLAQHSHRPRGRKSIVESSAVSPKPANSTISTAPRLELPMVASREEVFDIASDLLRHALDSGLYEGGRLVGEAVVLYMKSRAALHDEHIRQRQAKMAAQQGRTAPDNPLAFDLQNAAGYDNVDESDSDDESALDPLNDDEYDDATLNLMRRGVLPPDLQVMYALSLAGRGGMNFVAAKCLESIRSLEQENVDWLATEELVIKHPWLLFRVTRTGRLGRIDAYATVANVMKAAGKEKEFLGPLKQLFGDEQDVLEASGLLDACVDKNLSHTLSEFKKDKIVTILAALARYKVSETMTHAGEMLTEDARTQLLNSIDLIGELAPFLWSANGDGSVSTVRMEMLGTVAEVYTLVANSFGPSDLKSASLHRAAQSLSRWMPILSRCPDDESTSDLLSASGKRSAPDLKECPYVSTWQSPMQFRLSERCFSLLVAMNVSLFSGWGSVESPGLVRRRRDSREYFGISTAGIVAGHVPPRFKEEMVRQWELVSKYQPNASSSMDISLQLANLHESRWHNENKDTFENAWKTCRIARFGEEEAMDMFFAFSRVCLLLATQEESNDERIRDAMLCNALSVLLPVFQFCLRRPIWLSGIGGEIAVASVNKWRASALRNRSDVARISKRPTTVATREKEKLKVKVAEGWFECENFISPVQNLIPLPMSALRCVWKNDTEAASADVTRPTGRSAGELMQNIHVSMKRLRKCFTEHATERMAHQVAVALFELAEHQECENPFFCLQQAALFATQSPKRGNSDEPFKAPLPKPGTCTPREALIILGRADCLHSLHFCDEAAFLCSYVASVCSRHRDASVSDLEWNNAWKAISMIAYNVCVMIRVTARCVLRDKKAIERFEWTPSVLEEFKRGRLDGVALTGHSSADPPAGAHNATADDYMNTEESMQAVDVDMGYGGAFMATRQEAAAIPMPDNVPDASNFATYVNDTSALEQLAKQMEDELLKNQQEELSFPKEDDGSVTGEIMAV